MEKRILNELETIYCDLKNECKLYYNCRQCPHDKYCDKIADLIITINNHCQEIKKKKE